MSDLYGRVCYLNLADELEEFGRGGPEPQLEALDVAAAQAFAERHALPWPPSEGVEAALQRLAGLATEAQPARGTRP